MEEIEWNVVNEGQLLAAMVGHKPVGKWLNDPALGNPHNLTSIDRLGVNKYFQMALICEKLADSLNKEVSPEKIWAHLSTMYNLDVLDDNESIPFPNTEKEFSLPSSEFGDLLNKKEEEDEKKSLNELAKLAKDLKRDDKTPSKGVAKEGTPRRDSKDTKTPAGGGKKLEKSRGSAKGRATPKEERGRGKTDDTPKPTKRTRGDCCIMQGC